MLKVARTELTGDYFNDRKWMYWVCGINILYNDNNTFIFLWRFVDVNKRFTDEYNNYNLLWHILNNDNTNVLSFEYNNYNLLLDIEIQRIKMLIHKYLLNKQTYIILKNKNLIVKWES